MAFPLPEARRVVARVQELIAEAPDELLAVCALITTPDGHQAVAVAPGYFGDLSVAQSKVAPFRKIGTPVMEQLGPMPYTAIQTMFNDAAIPGRRYYIRSNYTNEMSAELVGGLADGFARAPSPLTAIIMVPMRGAVARVAPDATAYYHRSAAFTFSIIAGWLEPDEDAANVRWLKDLWADLMPHLPDAVYVNELDDEGGDRVRAAYGPSYRRLREIKKKYDPANLFRLNQNIMPA